MKELLISLTSRWLLTSFKLRLCPDFDALNSPNIFNTVLKSQYAALYRFVQIVSIVYIKRIPHFYKEYFYELSLYISDKMF